jgi:hypothetical protein
MAARAEGPDLSQPVCLVCDTRFSRPNKLNLRHYIHNEPDLKQVEDIFFTTFDLPQNQQSKVSFLNVPDTLPFCLKCAPMARNLVKLQQKIETLQAQATRVRDELVSIIVNTYIYTSDKSPHFPLKHLIFESK